MVPRSSDPYASAGLSARSAIPHFKRVRHFDDPGHAHCLTFSCYHSEPLLVHNEIRTTFLARLAEIRVTHAYRIWAYVLMPNHVHLLVRPPNEGMSVAEFLHALKGPVGYRAKRILTQHGQYVPRFWQSGPGFDENVTDLDRAAELAEYIHRNPVRKGLVKSTADWPWSSARYWAGLEGCELAMDAIR